MLRDFFLKTWAGIPATVRRVDIEQTIRTYLASFARGDIAGRTALFAEDVVVEEPVGTPPIVGRAALVQFWTQTKEAGWLVENTLRTLVVNGNEAIIVFRSTLSVPGEGEVLLDVHETLAFDDAGRICKLRAFNDEGSLGPEQGTTR